MARSTPCLLDRHGLAMRLVQEQPGEHSSDWATIQSVVGKPGMTPETLPRDDVDYRRAGITGGEREGIRKPGEDPG
jgi:hypothetical protein